MTLLARNKDNLDDLTRYRQQGDGNIINGIGQLFGTTISAAATGGSQIIKSLGHGIKDALSGVSDVDKSLIGSISNATATLVDTSATGVATIIDSIGGISSIVLYVLVFLLYGFLFYIHVFIRQRKPKNEDYMSVIKTCTGKDRIPSHPLPYPLPLPAPEILLPAPSPIPGPLSTFHHTPKRMGRKPQQLQLNPLYESI